MESKPTLSNYQILVIDDERRFTNIDVTTFYARKADEAILMLRRAWDQVWLDDDLGDTDIMEVVSWITENLPRISQLYVRNGENAQYIAAILNENYNVVIADNPRLQKVGTNGI